MTAGMAAKRPAAVVTSASAMPGATARRLAAPALPRPENAKEFVAFPPDAAEHPELLQDHGPGNDGKEKQEQEDDARNQTSLLENFKEIGDKNRGEQKNDVPLSENKIFSGRSKRSTRIQ